VALAARRVTVRFGGVKALRDVDFVVHASETCGVIGPNGAGKTTLFDVLSGLRTPTSGRVELDGRDVTSDGPVRRSRQGLRRTFQRQQTFGRLTVRDNVLVALESDGGGGGFAADLVGWPHRRRQERSRAGAVDEALELCGLTDVATALAGHLDIGRGRLLELARAVVARPSVLLLDEPTSGLEQSETVAFGAIIEVLRRERNTAIAMVEHDVEFISAHCQRVVVLDLGQVIADGAPADVRCRPEVQAAYLGVA